MHWHGTACCITCHSPTISATELHTCQRNKRKNGEGQIRTQHLFDQIAIDDFHSVFGCVT